MKVLAVVLVVPAVVIIAALLLRRHRAQSSVPPLSLKELIDCALVAVKSLDSEMPDLRESFRVSAYMGLGGTMVWTPEVRARLIERLRHVKVCLSRMDSNVLTFGTLGTLSWNYTMGHDNLALEIITKAAGCKLGLVYLHRRIRIYDSVPVYMWRLLGRKFATNILYSGNDLIQQYQSLAERVLVFIRARGENYQYECLLSAL